MSNLTPELKQQATEVAIDAIRAGARDEALISAIVDRNLYGAELIAQQRLDGYRNSKASTTAFLLAHPMEFASAFVVAASILFVGVSFIAYGGGSQVQIQPQTPIQSASTTRLR